MKTVLWTIISAAAGFALGTALRFRAPPEGVLPTPSVPVLGEFAGLGPQPVRLQLNPAELQRLQQETAAIERQAKAFRAELRVMEAEYRQRLESLLTDEQQRALRTESDGATAPLQTTRPLPRPAAGEPMPPDSADVTFVVPPPGNARPPGEALTPALPPEVFRSLLELTFVAWSTENLRSELGLSEEQTKRVRELLIERRQRFLELVDRQPPPTLRLLNLGQTLQQRDGP